MAKKKAKAVGKKRVKAAKKRVVKKKRIARGGKKVAKKAVKKRAKKVAKKPARKTRAPRAAKPKLPRRTRQAVPPPPPPAPVARPPVVAAPPPVPPPRPASFFPPSPPPPARDIPGFGAAEAGEENEPGPSWRGPAVGAFAPDFTLPDHAGTTHTLSQYRGKQVVLYFYPKDDTPGCTVEACSFRDALGSFADRDAVVLGVSPDSVASHQRFVQKYTLTFPLLADEGHRVAERYGVWVEKTHGGTTSMGIARTTFIIDADGCVAHVFRNVRPEGHEQQVLSKL